MCFATEVTEHSQMETIITPLHTQMTAAEM